MIVIGSWNVRGLNSHHKHLAVQQWMQRNKLDIAGIIEARILPQNLQGVQEQIAMQGWNFISNIQAAHHCRILVGWNANKVTLQCIHSESQWITCEVVSLQTKEAITVSFVYGLNSVAERSHLWNYIRQFKPASNITPWVVMGDFNATLRPSDRHGGDTRWLNHHEEFRESINTAGIFQPPYTGVHLTWDNGQQGSRTILKRLDWIFINPSLLERWPQAKAHFATRDISDHSAMTLSLSGRVKRKGTPFKFLNLWLEQDNFKEMIQEIWRSRLQGNPMEHLSANLWQVKEVLKRQHARCTSHIAHRAAEAKQAWRLAQLAMDNSPTSAEYFKHVLASPMTNNPPAVSNLFQKEIGEATAEEISIPFTDAEIKAALFSISDGIA
ncbi:hypothetical protein OIU78_029568 [Salix suchowensis]|nr:hypothetical protein OIU78_029568 [Salix suchowensis]